MLYSTDSNYICASWQINLLSRNAVIVCHAYAARTPNKKLLGSPDVVLPKYGVAIMVDGCLWHGHKDCQYATKPKTNVEFWETKIVRNRHRDEVTNAHLEAFGWTVITIW